MLPRTSLRVNSRRTGPDALDYVTVPISEEVARYVSRPICRARRGVRDVTVTIQSDSHEELEAAHKRLGRNANANVVGIEVGTGMVDLTTAREGDARVRDFMLYAVIRFDGGLSVECARATAAGLFEVMAVSAIEGGRRVQVRPTADEAVQADTYANAILGA